MKVIFPPGDEGVGVRARLNLLEERLRGEASQERFKVFFMPFHFWDIFGGEGGQETFLFGCFGCISTFWISLEGRLVRRSFKFSLCLSTFWISLKGRPVKRGFLDFFFKFLDIFEDKPVRRGFKFWDFFVNPTVANGILLCNITPWL